MNDENLIPLNKRPKSVQREIQSMGGQAKAEKTRVQNSIKAIFEAFGDSKNSEELQSAFDSIGLKADTKLKALIAKAFALGLAKNAKMNDILALVQMMAKYTGQEPAMKFAQTDSEGNDIPINDLSKVPTETLLKMAERVEEKIDE